MGDLTSMCVWGWSFVLLKFKGQNTAHTLSEVPEASWDCHAPFPQPPPVEETYHLALPTVSQKEGLGIVHGPSLICLYSA